MVVKIVKPTGKALLEKKTSKKGQTVSEQTTEEEVASPKSEPIEASPCMVECSMSYTHNLGDYNSLKMGVRLSIPAKHDEINDVYDFAKEWVEERLNAMVAENTKGE